MRNFFDNFFNTYLVKRDLTGILSFYTKNIVYIGTGEHETAIGIEEFTELLKREIKELPLPFQYKVLEYNDTEELENIRSIYAKLFIAYKSGDYKTDMTIRFTASCILEDGEWKIFCVHFSSPSKYQGEGQFFPLLFGSRITDKLSAKLKSELMNIVMETLPSGFMGNYLEDGFPIYTVNNKMLDIFGYTYTELMDISHGKAINLICEDDRENIYKEILRQIDKKEGYSVEYRLKTKGGNLIWVEDVGRKVILDFEKETLFRIITVITERKERELKEEKLKQKMQVMAYTDPLTGLENRTSFNERLFEYNSQENLGCVVGDMNNLKFCNDKYGHSEGDKIITDAAMCIRQAFNGIGTGYRIGGDEFCILIPNCDKSKILKALEKTNSLIAEKNKNRAMPISIAFGYAIRYGLDESVESLFNRSDEMMYDTKSRMKSEFSVWRDEKISNYLNVLRVLRKSTDDYLFLWDIGRDEFWYFEELYLEYLGYVYEKPTISSKEVQRFVYPADRKMLSEDLNRVANGVQREHNLNYRWINKKGEIVWISCRGQAITDDKGKPYCMIGRISDQLLRHLYNPLTRLFNKEKFIKDYEENDFRNGYFLLLSINNMNNINLKHGRDCGDSVIKKCAEVIEQSGTAQNLWHVDGNRFILYLGDKSEDDVRDIYNELLKKLDNICTLSASAIYNNENIFKFAHELYSIAEMTLKKSIEIGGTLLFFDNKDLEKHKRTLQLFEELNTSVENGCEDFYLNFQPLVKCGNYEIYGAEALLRYHSETFGEVYPDEFIPLLEDSKLICNVGLWVLENALIQCKNWRKFIPNFHINVNFSAVQLDDSRITEQVLEILEKTNMTGDALTIEVTENIQLHHIEYLNEIFKIWRNAGIELSIDDFGTGYASLGYLKAVNVAEIKIPKLFVEEISEATYNYRLISNMIDFARNNNIRICCEGVEDIKELTVLEQLAPTLIQGYLFAKPCNKDTFERTFIDNKKTEYDEFTKHIHNIYQHKSSMSLIHFDARDILKETDMGLWIIRINEDGTYREMHANETMEYVLGVDKKYTPAECYDFWFSRIDNEYAEYVKNNVNYMMESPHVVQLQYPWNHPTLGKVTVRCSGKRTENTDGMITLKGYHLISSNIEEMND